MITKTTIICFIFNILMCFATYLFYELGKEHAMDDLKTCVEGQMKYKGYLPLDAYYKKAYESVEDCFEDSTKNQ